MINVTRWGEVFHESTNSNGFLQYLVSSVYDLNGNWQLPESLPVLTSDATYIYKIYFLIANQIKYKDRLIGDFTATSQPLTYTYRSLKLT